jgi:transcriptional regulator with XRE-family HTH domain
MKTASASNRSDGDDDRHPRPHVVDIHVGKQLRMCRAMLGISQGVLADQIGITFQQIQKYECGTNRVSASKLYDIAKTLDVPISFFFAGLSEAEGDPDGKAVWGRSEEELYAATAEGRRWNRAMSRLPKEQRIMIVALANALAKVETEPDLLVEAADSAP